MSDEIAFTTGELQVTGPMEIEPTLIKVTYSFTAYGFMFTLNPKDDLTPIELWNIQQWMDLMRHSWSSTTANEKLWDEAKRLKIDRHFDECQVDFSNGQD